MQSADFFRADNPEGMEARNEVSVSGRVFVFFSRIELFVSRAQVDAIYVDGLIIVYVD